MKTLQEIDYTPLQQMKGAWGRVIRETFKVPPAVLFVGLAVVILVAAYFVGQMAQLVIWPVVALLGWLSKKIVDSRNRAWELFAQANGWYVVHHAGSLFVPPGLANIGRGQLLSPVVHAQFEGHECDVMMYQFTTGSGKNSVTHFYTVARVLLERPFPHLILDSKSTWAIQQRGSAKERVRLEGDFDKYFSLYCRPGEHVDALSIITPDVMRTLIDANRPQDVEIIDNYLYFMSAQDRRNADAMPPLLAAVDALADQIAHKAKTIHYQPEGTPPTGHLQSALSAYFRSGDRVSNNVAMAIAFILLLPILLLIIVGFMMSTLPKIP